MTQVNNTSALERCKQLEGQLKRLLAGQDMSALPTEAKQAVTAIRRNISDARLDVRDYEYSETRSEQLALAEAGKGRLELVRQAVLTASEYNVFSAIDVAHTTATIEQITKQLD